MAPAERAKFVEPKAMAMTQSVYIGHILGAVPEWHAQAPCAQTDPESFFPEPGNSTKAAKKVCQACEVRSDCLGYALENNERFGVWGGLSERERRYLKGSAE